MSEEKIMLRMTVRRKGLDYNFYLMVTYMLNVSATFISIVQPSQKGKLPPIDNSILFHSATNLVDKIKKQEIKCVDVIKAYIDRIYVVQTFINAVIDSRFDETLEEAKKIDQILTNGSVEEKEKLFRLPLLGVPFTCKDSISIEGLTQSSRSLYRRGNKGTKDATVIQNMR